MEKETSLCKGLIEKTEKYRELTETALEKARITVPENSSLYVVAKDFYEMSENYFNDAKHFQDEGKYGMALAAFSYSHAWLDAGARAGLFEVNNDYRLFTLFK